MRNRMNDFMHEQYLIADLFDALHSETRSHRKAYCRLGITMEDIYPGEEWNYVFGQAKPMERVGNSFGIVRIRARQPSAYDINTSCRKSSQPSSDFHMS